ncbi:MAG: guanylate kinase [Chlorobium sp.]
MVEKKQYSGKLIVFSAPSGTGKSTVVHLALKRLPNIRFSVSATTRKIRQGEVDGINYYFLDKEDFETKIREDAFIEHEFFFGNYYGTLFDKTIQIIAKGEHILLDLDVKGALNLKKFFPDNSLLLFLKPPSMEVLRERLRVRETENERDREVRLERAVMELEYAEMFDEIVVNDILDSAVDTVTAIINKFISKT